MTCVTMLVLQSAGTTFTCQNCPIQILQMQISSYFLVLTETDVGGLRRSDMVSWYLKEMESEIDSEAELLEKKTVIEKVLDRLVHHVRK